VNDSHSWRYRSTERGSGWPQQGVRGGYLLIFVAYCGECITAWKSSCGGCVQLFELNIRATGLKGKKHCMSTKLSSWIHFAFLQTQGKNCLLRLRLQQSSFPLFNLNSHRGYHILIKLHLWVLGGGSDVRLPSVGCMPKAQAQRGDPAARSALALPRAAPAAGERRWQGCRCSGGPRGKGRSCRRKCAQEGTERGKQARTRAKGKLMAQFEMVRQYAVNSLTGTRPHPMRYSTLSLDNGLD